MAQFETTGTPWIEAASADAKTDRDGAFSAFVVFDSSLLNRKPNFLCNQKRPKHSPCQATLRPAITRSEVTRSFAKSALTQACQGLGDNPFAQQFERSNPPIGRHGSLTVQPHRHSSRLVGIVRLRLHVGDRLLNSEPQVD